MQQKEVEITSFYFFIFLKTFTIIPYSIYYSIFPPHLPSKVMYIYLISENSYDNISLLFFSFYPYPYYLIKASTIFTQKQDDHNLKDS